MLILLSLYKPDNQIFVKCITLCIALCIALKIGVSFKVYYLCTCQPINRGSVLVKTHTGGALLHVWQW